MKRIPLLFLVFLSSISVFAQKNVKLRSIVNFKPGVPAGNTLANICGYTDPSGKEYALVGTFYGMSIVEITNPSAPVVRDSTPGPTSEWREIKTYKGYAYVTSEGGGGVQIVDLHSLPGNVTYKSWDNGGAITSIHALHIDTTKGFLYVFGSSLNNGAPIIADLSDPWNPVYVNTFLYSTGYSQYVHDGYADNDTLYSGHIYVGKLVITDMHDKSNPVVLAEQVTPGAFTHNTWLSVNHKVILTTDEVSNSFLTSYDISDLNNIRELDRFQCTPGSNSIVHNTHNIKDYAVTSWYRDGVRIVDAHKPDNLVEVGYYDTDATSGDGYHGCWGAFPYFPSGTIVASNMEGQMYVLSPTYVRAAYVEGIVTDSVTGAPISGVKVNFSGGVQYKVSKGDGSYKFGTPDTGIQTLSFMKSGYYKKTVQVNMKSTQVASLNVKLKPIVTGMETEKENELRISPNPFNSLINLSVVNQNTIVRLKDITGKILLERSINGTSTLDLSSLQTGIYLMEVKEEGKEIKFLKLVKTE